jgi:hypothetical protein
MTNDQVLNGVRKFTGLAGANKHLRGSPRRVVSETSDNPVRGVSESGAPLDPDYGPAVTT